MEDKKIQSLKKEIAKMEASYEKSSTPQSVKNILKKSIDAAKGRLEKMEAKPEPKKEEPKSEPAKPKAKRKPSTALSKLIRRTKSKGYEPYKGKKVDLVRDAGKKAKAPGKRVSKTGRTYWESRPNRIDVKQKAKSAPYLEKGGELIKPMAAYGDMVYNTLENALSSMKRLVKPQNYTLIKSEANRFMVTTNNRAAKFVNQGWEYVSRMSNPFSEKFAYGGVMGYEEGGYMAKGGKLKVGGDDFSFLLELSDKELSKRLDLVREQQAINSNQYFETREKGNSTNSIEESGKKLQNEETAIIQARMKKMADGGYMAEGGMMADGGMIWASPTLRKKYESAFGKDFKPEYAIEEIPNKILLIESYYWNYLLDVLEIEEVDEKAANDWKVAKEVEDGKLVQKGPYSSRYMYSPSLNKIREQTEGEWYKYGSASDFFTKGGMMAEGGALEHGLQEGDKILVVRGNIIGVMNEETGEQATIDISTGERKSSSGQSYDSGGMLNKYEPVLGLKEDYWPGTSIPKVLLKTTIKYDKDRLGGMIGPEENWGYGLAMETFKTAAPKYINIEYQKILKTTKPNNKNREEAEKIAEKVIPELKEKSIAWVKENYDDIFWDVMAKKEKTGKESSSESYASGGTISKSYEPIEGTQYELKVQVYYDKGGMNYFSGRPEARGYYASVSPVQVERRDNGIVVESYAAFSGVKQLLVETQRSSPKGEREAMQKAEEVIPQLKAHVIEKLRNKLGN